MNGGAPAQRNLLLAVDESSSSEQVFKWALDEFYRVSVCVCVGGGVLEHRG
jgi:hypothetical protein